MINHPVASLASAQLHLGEDVSWVILSLGTSWVAVAKDRVKALFDTSAKKLTPGPVPGSWTQQGQEGMVWRCDDELRPLDAPPKGQILWLITTAGELGLVCERAEEVAAGPLVSVQGLPPVLVDADGLMIGLLLPDKRRVVGVIDVDVLYRQLRDAMTAQGESHGTAG